jgi:hypothetical protein
LLLVLQNDLLLLKKAAEIYVPTLISGQRFSSWNRTKVASTLEVFRNQDATHFSLATEKYIYLVFNIY